MRHAEFEENGFAILESAIDELTVAQLAAAVATLKLSETAARGGGSIYGVRNLLNLVTTVRKFAESRVAREIAVRFLGKRARVVRAIFFDKTAAANWKVPWHQDLTIAVREKRQIAGFSPWTRKAGVWHVQPPAEILESMLTLRFHLDAADESNGALKVVPRSHRAGRLGAAEIKARREANEIRVCRVKKGDCLLMRPLLVHSSSAGTSPRRRRVIHLEFAAENLPGGLQWYGS